MMIGIVILSRTAKNILLSLEMQPGNNIVDFGKDMDKALDKFRAQCPSDIEVAKISALPKYIKDSISNFKIKEASISIEQSAHQIKEAFTNYFPQVSTFQKEVTTDEVLLKTEILFWK
jgi:hypothetical protein